MVVKQLRTRNNWSQQQLAELSGLNVRTIQRVENGSPASLETLKSLASVFEVDVSMLKDEVSVIDSETEAGSSSLLYELKQRKVIQTGFIYILVSSVLMQVILTKQPASSALLLSLISLGFPFSLYLTWRYKLVQKNSRPEHGKNLRRGQLEVGTVVMTSLVLMTGLAVGLDYFNEKGIVDGGEKSRLSAQSIGTDEAITASNRPPEKSIAVLPFVNLSNDSEQEYFTDGLTEEIMNRLAQINDLSVTGKTASFYYKNSHKDLRAIGEALGVSYLLEGSVRKSGNQLRITAQLIKTDEGFHLWSETYDRTVAEVFAIQDEISENVATALSVKLLYRPDSEFSDPR